MIKKLIKRSLFGFPAGIFISYVITILISAFWGQGHYLAVTPELIEKTGNEMNAVLLQAVFSGVLGAGFAMASVIWEMEAWSIVKQTSVYFVIISAILLPIAYFLNWMQHTAAGFITYFGIFVGVFLVIWLLQYFGWKAKVNKLNTRIKGK